MRGKSRSQCHEPNPAGTSPVHSRRRACFVIASDWSTPLPRGRTAALAGDHMMEIGLTETGTILTPMCVPTAFVGERQPTGLPTRTLCNGAAALHMHPVKVCHVVTGDCVTASLLPHRLWPHDMFRTVRVAAPTLPLGPFVASSGQASDVTDGAACGMQRGFRHRRRGEALHPACRRAAPGVSGGAPPVHLRRAHARGPSAPPPSRCVPISVLWQHPERPLSVAVAERRPGEPVGGVHR
jgi:hypothetical protein